MAQYACQGSSRLKYHCIVLRGQGEAWFGGYGDADSETVSACAAPSGYSDDATDCDDDEAAVNAPTAKEFMLAGLRPGEKLPGGETVTDILDSGRRDNVTRTATPRRRDAARPAAAQHT